MPTLPWFVKRCIILLFVFLSSSATFAQYSTSEPSSGRKKVEAAYAYQAKLSDSSISIAQAIERWRSIARDPEVRSDHDALAVALGCEGLLEMQREQPLRADSLLATAMPLFRLRQSKAYFLVAYAELERKLAKNRVAIRAYQEIIETLDSVPELEYIDYYRLSGYAPFAYAIDAAYGLAKIGEIDSSQRSPAISILKASMIRHSSVPLTLMCASALKRIDPAHADQYDFQINLICSRAPSQRTLVDKFAKRLN